MAINSLADPVDRFQSYIGQRKQSVIPSDLGDFGSIDLDALSTNPSNISLGEPTSKNALVDKLLPSRINSERSGDIAAQSSQFPSSKYALLSSMKDKVPKDHVRSQPTSDNFAQYAMQPSPTFYQGDSSIDADDFELDPDVLDLMNP